MKTKISLIGLALVILGNLMIFASAGAFNSRERVSCSDPTKEDLSFYLQLEEEILRATVRIGIKSWVAKTGERGYEGDYSAGHATLMGGRYLVTHNHFGIPLPGLPMEGVEAYGQTISLYDSRGQRLHKGPLSDFNVVWVAGETLVLMHNEEGFFEGLGLKSARFQAWTSMPIETGTEVAQIDWDGAVTRVDWVEVKEVVGDDGVPRLILDDGVQPGASGGGIFWQGIHVANNWLYQAKITETGETFEEATTAALNPQAEIFQLQQPAPAGSDQTS